MNIPVVHKSTITTAEQCMNMLKYKEVDKLKPQTKSEAAILGTALHDTIDELHKAHKDKPWDISLPYITKWFHTFQAKSQQIIDDAHKNNIEVELRKEDKWSDHLEMIAGYMQKPYNRFAQPILIEAPFRFSIKQGKTIYQFAGIIDQILKVESRYISDYINIDTTSPYFINPSNSQSYIYLERDVKTGEKHVSYTDIEFSNDLNVYSYACAYGEFYINSTWRKINLIPYAHCLYFIQDHIQYKRKYGTKEKGDEHGPGMYFCYRYLDKLNHLKEELVKLHKYVNSGNWVRTGATTGACNLFCDYKDICIKQFHGEI